MSTVKQFQTVIVRLRGRSRDDEEAVTDLLNERARGGWLLHSATSPEPHKLLLVFQRDA